MARISCDADLKREEAEAFDDGPAAESALSRQQTDSWRAAARALNPSPRLGVHDQRSSQADSSGNSALLRQRTAAAALSRISGSAVDSPLDLRLQRPQFA